MEKMNRSELRSGLIEQNLIDEAGTVNAFKVNLISGSHTWLLLSEVCPIAKGYRACYT